MAVFDLSWDQGRWAKTLHSIIIWNTLEHLFLPCTAKQQLYHHCALNLVRIRFSCFSKPWNALIRSSHADHFKLWIDENGYVFWKICWHEISHMNMFSHDSFLIAWFGVYGCWIIDEHVELFRVICLFPISGQNVFHDFVMKMKMLLYSKP